MIKVPRRQEAVLCPNLGKDFHGHSCLLCFNGSFVVVYCDTNGGIPNIENIRHDSELIVPITERCAICGGTGKFGLNGRNQAKVCYNCKSNQKALA